MIIAILILLGLCFGSFVNALVWRLHEQASLKPKKRSQSPKTSHLKPPTNDLSVVTGRSMCPHCKHTLSGLDLIPVLSWLSLRGKCRYCHKPIHWQYPLVELSVAVSFILSYAFWPYEFTAAGVVRFAIWLFALVCFHALVVYDLRWMLLPNKIVFPLTVIAGLGVIVASIVSRDPSLLVDGVLGLAVAGGIFYVLFQISNGKWIGGGDVKLGFALGLLLASPMLGFLMLFVASLLGTLYALPGMVSGRLNRTSRVPFGPFLIISTIIVQLLGNRIIEWYSGRVLGL